MTSREEVEKTISSLESEISWLKNEVKQSGASLVRLQHSIRLKVCEIDLRGWKSELLEGGAQ